MRLHFKAECSDASMSLPSQSLTISRSILSTRLLDIMSVLTAESDCNRRTRTQREKRFD
jgi:hypothetical protein